MADKELSVFIVDTHVPSASCDYLFETLAAKLIKGLKTDYVSVVAFNASATDHFAADTGKYVGVNTLMDFEVPTFDGLKNLRRRLLELCKRSSSSSRDCSDAIQTVLFASHFFKPTLKKVFTRNIVLIASEEVPGSELVDQVPRFYANYPTNLYLIHDGDTPHVYETLCSMFASSLKFSSESAADALKRHHPLKKTRPVAAYKGQLRLGADYPAALDHSTYRAEADDLCICFDIEVFPAVRSESSQSNTHDYIVDNEDVIKVKRVTSHYVLEKSAQANDAILSENPTQAGVDTEKSYDKVPVDAHKLTPGLEFSNYDLIALDDDLMKSTKLELTSAFDIFGFINLDHIPQHLFTEEPFYVVPEKASSKRSMSAFMAFTEALLARKVAGLCRLIRKQEKEIEVGALIPVRIKRTEKYTPCLLFIRLPFKQDEKIGNFPPLSQGSKLYQESEESYDENGVNSLMEEFIEQKTANEALDNVADKPSILTDPKITMLGSESSKLSLPPKTATSDPLSCTAPSTSKFNNYMRQVILTSLDAEKWVEHFKDPEFIEHNLRGENHTNLYTIPTCMSSNSTFDVASWAGSQSSTAEKRLVEKLDIKYERRDDSKKRKPESNEAYKSKGNYGADEGDYGQVPDFEL